MVPALDWLLVNRAIVYQKFLNSPRTCSPPSESLDHLYLIKNMDSSLKANAVLIGDAKQENYVAFGFQGQGFCFGVWQPMPSIHLQPLILIRAVGAAG